MVLSLFALISSKEQGWSGEMLPLQLQVVFLLVPWHFLQVLAPCWTMTRTVMVIRSLCVVKLNARGARQVRRVGQGGAVAATEIHHAAAAGGERHLAAGLLSQGFSGSMQR
jgi:hypothetical protein